ncbi:MAG: acyltransferase [Deltaproteobacteria bacterium]|nr:acyltransferase [Deltaproteobacteria bacterium]
MHENELESTKVPKRVHLKMLTGIRFLAALHVVIYHLWRYDAWHPPGIVLDAVAAGPVAVTLFFVLSGFILTYTYASTDGESASLLSSSTAFWRVRFARIYPVYALGLLISLPIVLVLAKRAQGDVGLEMGKGAAAFLLV